MFTKNMKIIFLPVALLVYANISYGQFMTNTPATSILEFSVFATASNMTSMVSNVVMTNKVASNYGGRLLTISTDRAAIILLKTNKTTNYLKNLGNHDDTFRLRIIKTNLSVAGLKFRYWFEDINGIKISNLGPIPRHSTNKFKFNVVFSNGNMPNHVEFRLGAQSMMGMNTFSTAYTGDYNAIKYGGDIGKSGLKGVVPQTNAPYQNDSFIRFSIGDNTPPTWVTLYKPYTNTYTNNTTVYFCWGKASDLESDIAGYQIEVDDDPSFAFPEKSSNIVDSTITNCTLTLTEGLKYWRVRALNGAGMYSTTNRVWNFKIDTILPTAPLLVFPKNNTCTNNGSLNIRWTKSSDAGSGISNYHVVMSSNNWSSTQRSMWSGSSGTTNIVLVLGNSLWRWKVLAKDKDGNIGLYSGVSNFTVDTLAPNAPTLSVPLNNVMTNTGVLSFRWNKTTDNGLAGITNYHIVMSSNNWISTQKSVWSGSSETTNIALTLGNSLWRWKVIAKDKAGNTNISAVSTFIIDTQAPNVTLLSSPSNNTMTNTGNITFNWYKPLDNGLTGISNYMLIISSNNFVSTQRSYNVIGSNQLSYVPAPLSAGVWTWRVAAVDKVNNVGTWSAVWTNTIDLIVPSISLISPTNQSILDMTNVTLLWSSSDDLTGVTETTLAVYTNGVNYILTNLLVSTQYVDVFTGTNYTWRVRVQDKAGNTNWSVLNAFRIRLADHMPPTAVSLIGPTNHSWTSNLQSSYGWTRSTDLSGTVTNYRIELSTDNFMTVVIASNITTTNAVVSVTGEGSWYWRIWSFDASGNSNVSMSFTNNIDRTAPFISLLTPSDNGLLLQNDVTFNWSANDGLGIGVQDYLLQISADDFVTVFKFTNLTGTASQLTLTNDTWQWRVRAVDQLGNARYSVTNTFEVRPYFASVTGNIRVTDGVHDIVIGSSSADTNQRVAGNTGVKIFIPMGGDVNPSSSIQIYYTLDGSIPMTNVNPLTATWNGTMWLVDIPDAITINSVGNVFKFRIMADGYSITNSMTADNSWGFRIAEIEEQQNSITVIPTIMDSASGVPLSIIYKTTKKTRVFVSVYNISGDLVRNIVDETQDADTYVAHWDGRNIRDQEVGGGIYFIIVKFDDDRPAIRKVVVK